MPTPQSTDTPIPTHESPPLTKPTDTLAPTPETTSTPAPEPTPTIIIYPTEGLKGWLEYKDAEHGFSFHYPPEWTVAMDERAQTTSYQHLLWLKPPQYPLVQMSIGFKRVGEDIGIQRTGLGAGDIVRRGTVLFLGGPVNREVLVAEGKDMSVLYNGGSEIQRGDLVFTINLDYAGSPMDKTALTDDVEANADLIAASFEAAGYQSGGTPMTISEEDSGKTIELNKGDTLVVTLEGNITTGYNWEMLAQDPAILQQVGEPEATPESDKLGAPSMIALKFEAVKTGQATLKMVYRRSFEKDVQPLMTFEVTVVVK
jgi:inhibitor of cysteine peptidase